MAIPLNVVPEERSEVDPDGDDVGNQNEDTAADP